MSAARPPATSDLVRERIQSKKVNLAFTAALEHYTATLAELVLTDEQAQQDVGRSTARDIRSGARADPEQEGEPGLHGSARALHRHPRRTRPDRRAGAAGCRPLDRPRHPIWCASGSRARR